jgi:hypothetical protein
MRLGYAHYILGVKRFYASTSSGLCSALYETPQRATERSTLCSKNIGGIRVCEVERREPLGSVARDEDSKSVEAGELKSPLTAPESSS